MAKGRRESNEAHTQLATANECDDDGALLMKDPMASLQHGPEPPPGQWQGYVVRPATPGEPISSGDSEF